MIDAASSICIASSMRPRLVTWGAPATAATIGERYMRATSSLIASGCTWVSASTMATSSCRASRRPALSRSALPRLTISRTWVTRSAESVGQTREMATERQVERALVRVRQICTALPEVTERLSHGAPSFFVRGKRTLAMFMDDHHGDGILGLWCPALPGVQAELVEAEPDRFYRPPYVGPLRMGGRAPRPRGRLGRGGGDPRRQLPQGGAEVAGAAARRRLKVRRVALVDDDRTAGWRTYVKRPRWRASTRTRASERAQSVSSAGSSSVTVSTPGGAVAVTPRVGPIGPVIRRSTISATAAAPPPRRRPRCW